MQYNGENCVVTAKKNIVEKFIERKTYFKIFLTQSFNFFALALNFPLLIWYYLQIESFFDTIGIFGSIEP